MTSGSRVTTQMLSRRAAQTVIVTRAASPVPSVGGLRQGAPRLRSAGRYSFQGSARPAHSVGGLGPGRPSSAGFARATDPGGGSEGAVEAPFDDLGGLRRGAARLRSACRYSFQQGGEAGALGGWAGARPPFERGLRPRNRSWGRLGG